MTGYGGGQPYGDGRAGAGRGGDRGCPAGLASYAVDNGQAETAALGGRFGREERLEGALDDPRFHSGATVARGQAHVGPRRQAQVRRLTGSGRHVLGLNREAAARGHGVPGVRREVQEDLLDLGGVDGDRPEPGGQGQPEVGARAGFAPQQLVDPADDRVEVDEPGADHVAAPRLAQQFDELDQSLPGLLDVVGIPADAGQIEAGAALRRPGGLVADGGGVAHDGPELVVEFVGDAVGEPADAFQPLHPLKVSLHAGQPRALPGFGDGAADDRRQPGGPVLQDVVAGSLPDELDRRFVADRTGHDDDRRARAPVLRDLDGTLAGEARQREIGQDHVRAEGVDLLRVGGGRVDDDGREVQARVGEEALFEFGIGRIVLQDEDTQPAPPGSTCLPVRPGLPRAGGRGWLSSPRVAAALPVNH
jgi:hypothetical protein